MAQLGVRVYEQATSVSTPNVAKVGIPFVVGTAPVHTAAKPAKPNIPVLATSWDEAVEKLGFSYDWEKYTLCEFIYSHFKLFGQQPAIFCNILDSATMKKASTPDDYPVTNHQVVLPIDAIAGSLKVTVPGSGEGAEPVNLKLDEDFSVFYDRDDTDTYVCIVELLESGEAYDAVTLNIGYEAVTPETATVADVVDGVGQVDAAMTVVGTVPDLIAAPGWSHNTVVAAVMTTKAAAISGLFKGKAVLDVDSSAEGVTEYSQLSGWKNKNNMVDPDQILCWPMVQLGSYRFHLSTQMCGLMASVDTGNRGVPYESPSNKNLKMDACVLADGTEVNLTWPQVEMVAGDWGVVTAVNFLDSGWVAKGNYTACYPGNTDVKDQFIPVSRMFDFIGNTLIRTFWPKQDKPMTTPLRDSIIQTCNIWMGGLCGSGYLYGARCELLAKAPPPRGGGAGLDHCTLRRSLRASCRTRERLRFAPAAASYIHFGMLTVRRMARSSFSSARTRLTNSFCSWVILSTRLAAGISWPTSIVHSNHCFKASCAIYRAFSRDFPSLIQPGRSG